MEAVETWDWAALLLSEYLQEKMSVDSAFQLVFGLCVVEVLSEIEQTDCCRWHCV